MVKNEYARNGYSEEFDGARLMQIAGMAARYVAKEEGKLPERLLRLPRVPNGSFSDFECGVWGIFTNAVRTGMKIAENIDTSFDMTMSNCD